MAPEADTEIGLNQSEALELFAYLVMSAREGLSEPAPYLLFRLVSAAVKVAERWEPRSPAAVRPLIESFLQSAAIESPKFQSDPEAFAAFLKSSSRELAAYVKTLDWT